jgi:hypothetical protein
VNGFLWLGVACTLLLVVSVVVDAFDDALDALDVGPPWLSVAVVTAFGAAFGFGTGAFVDSIGLLALVPGVIAGGAFAWLAARLTAAAVHLPTGVTDTDEALLGSLGRIVTPPSPPRVGEALLHRPTGPVKVACTADEPLAAGTEVVVVDVRSSTFVHVQAFDLALPADPPSQEHPTP